MGDNCLKVVAAAATTNNVTDFPLKMKPDEGETSGTKKLMQARLPFKPLHQKVGKPAVANPKKRKLNEQDTGAAKFPKLLKSLTENKSKLNTSHDNSDMEVCDGVISSSESGNTSVSSQRAVKSHTLDKFFSPRNVQDEIISSSTNDYVDLTKSDGEEEVQVEDKIEESSEKEKENKLSDAFSEDANFTCQIENKVKTNSSSKLALSTKILREKYDRTALPQNKLMAEVRVVLEDVALCDIPGCSTPKSFKKYLNNSAKSSKSIDLSSPIKGKEDTGSGLDNSIVCVTPDNEFCETMSTSTTSSHSEAGVSTQSPHASERSGTPKTVRVKTKVSSTKKSQRDAIRQKVKDERERERLQRKQQKEAERLGKLEQRKKEKEKKEQEKQHLKILKEKERQEKKELLEKERQEKEKLKEDQRRKKQEIIEAKQEEKRKKEEEKKLKEEEKMKEEEEKLRKQERTKAAFQNYFLLKPKEMSNIKTKEHSGLFMPFEVKNNMRMAPSCRRSTAEELTENLDALMSTQKHDTLYLEELRTGRFTPRKSLKTWPKEEEPEDVYHISHEEDVVKKVTYRVKLLQFHTNYRPPYYGTWRKKSSVLTPKFPWKQDTKLFDYEIDSDDEWEEEEPGESLSSSEGEEDKEEKEEKEEDEDDEDGWMVPHGYLSEGEGCEDDEEVTPEMLKARQAAKAESWERQRKQQCLPHKLEHIGCVWEGDQIDALILDKLLEFKVCNIDGEFPIGTSYNGITKDLEPTETRSTSYLKKRAVPEEAMPDLIKFIHGNRAGIKKLVIEFQMFWNSKNSDVVSKASQGETAKPESNVDSTPGTPAEKMDSSKQTSTPNTSINESDAPEENFIISKRQLDKKITTIAVREKRSDFPKICWYVHPEMLKQYGLENLTLRDKVLEKKAAEENPACASIPSKNTTPNQANVSESKTPTSKTPSRDQMSILSFAQTADKLNTSRSDGECEIIETKSLDLKSHANKQFRRDQMSILSFTRAANEKMLIDLTGLDGQPSDNGKVMKDERKINTAAKSLVNITECSPSVGSTPDAVVNKIHDDCMEDGTNNGSGKDHLSVVNVNKTDIEKATNLPHSPDEMNVASLETTTQEKLPETKSTIVDVTSANNTTATPEQNLNMAASPVPQTVTAKEDKTISDKGKP